MAKLNADTAKQYDLVDWVGGKKQYFGTKFGTVDVQTLTPEQAKRLVSRGFKKLRKKGSKAVASTSGNDK